MEILYAMLISVIIAGIGSIFLTIYFDKLMQKKDSIHNKKDSNKIK